MNDTPQRDEQNRPDSERRRGGAFFQGLGGAAIAVVLLLPIFVLGQQANNLAIARLQLELAQLRSSLGVQSAAGTAAATPAPSPAPTQPAPAPSPTPTPSPPRTPSPTPTPSARPDEDGSQVTRAITDLSRKIEGLTASGSSPSPVPVVPRVLRRPAIPANLGDVRVRVEYQSRCLQMAVKVADRLISLGADPQLVEGSQRGLQVARAMYDTEEQLSTATQIAEGLAGVTTVDVVANDGGRSLDMIRLELAGDDACGRPPEP